MFWNRRNGNLQYAAPTAPGPEARSLDLIVQEVEDEVLVYDEFNGWAHCLNPELARIWRACDGKTSVHAIATELELDVDVVTAALAELDEQALLQPGYTPPTALSNGNGDGTTRREFGVKAAKVGGAVAAGPAIYSIIAPTALASATTPNFLCNYFSGQSCNACTFICGCCCCCQGCSTSTNFPSCKMCSSIDFCNTAEVNVKKNGDPNGQNGCADQLKRLNPAATTACTSGPNCSATAQDPPKCQAPCVNGIPNPEACGTHELDTGECNCFGTPGNPCGNTT